jgi:ABC-type nitrate/sulfonate/bicarbonate transport system substrate-binding protein
MLDAVVIWQPFLLDIETRSKSDLAVWSVQNDQPTHCLLIANESWALANAGATRRFLEALSDANDFVYASNEEAKAFIRGRLDYSDEYIARIWSEHELSLSLDQSVVTEMEDESRWLIRNGLVTATEVPNFLAYVNEAGLAKVMPEAVRVVR